MKTPLWISTEKKKPEIVTAGEHEFLRAHHFRSVGNGSYRHPDHNDRKWGTRSIVKNEDNSWSVCGPFGGATVGMLRKSFDNVNKAIYEADINLPWSHGKDDSVSQEDHNFLRDSGFYIASGGVYMEVNDNGKLGFFAIELRPELGGPAVIYDFENEYFFPKDMPRRKCASALEAVNWFDL